MSLSDPVADMLTRIRNAVMVKQNEVTVKASKVCEGIAQVLLSEGFIKEYDRIEDTGQGILRIKLKYSELGTPVITDLQRVSTPGKRVYGSVEDLPRVLGGLGVSIVSTSQGVLSDVNCRKNKIGGEILCTVS
ncbi:30S ribosomal protein S8 [Sedimentisphaera salicampi]|uniref:Small ribosomal subunit protein uS8 n=1 Tax=Sedimentisphaera salicampi TaxID=1941349 RepID=A0A1W6LPL4_9BACT|nr:30S ribosomal protein S8 [Sedimentisphaera salicampi]ARN57663.1 30S ribosomal protein S8 [Sedimentisphaera salicampi]OXU14228.1 30S ribosomal protein S8 [Sedimentisphaera salicampi]